MVPFYSLNRDEKVILCSYTTSWIRNQSVRNYLHRWSSVIMGEEVRRQSEKTNNRCNYNSIQYSLINWKAGYGFHLFRP